MLPNWIWSCCWIRLYKVLCDAYFFFFFFFFGHSMQWLDESSVPRPGIELRPQWWKCHILTTRPPGNSLWWLILCTKLAIPWYLDIWSNMSGMLLWRYFIYFFVFMAAPTAYGSSQPRVWIQAAAASLYHSHSNSRAEPHQWPRLQLRAMPDPSPTEWGQGSNPHPHRY